MKSCPFATVALSDRRRMHVLVELLRIARPPQTTRSRSFPLSQLDAALEPRAEQEGGCHQKRRLAWAAQTGAYTPRSPSFAAGRASTAAEVLNLEDLAPSLLLQQKAHTLVAGRLFAVERQARSVRGSSRALTWRPHEHLDRVIERRLCVAAQRNLAFVYDDACQPEREHC